MKVEDNMKKITSSSAMSISGIRLISGSSFILRDFSLMRCERCGRRSRAARRVGAERIGEVHRDLFHLDHDALHLAAQVAVPM